MNENRRADDQGALCRLARIASLGWDWVDRRQIVERFVALAILYGTVLVTRWAMSYAEGHAEASGTDAAAIIGSVLHVHGGSWDFGRS
jgi:hypothetical protein